MKPKLTWTQQSQESEIAVAIQGEIDLFTAPRFQEELFQWTQARPSRLVLDLEAVRYIDSTGLHALLNAHRRLKSQAGKLVVQGCSATIRRAMQTIWLDRLIEVSS
jgi:anti-sigma B factor antagonist